MRARRVVWFFDHRPLRCDPNGKEGAMWSEREDDGKQPATSTRSPKKDGAPKSCQHSPGMICASA